MDILLFIVISLLISFYTYKRGLYTSDGAAFVFIITASLYITGGLLFYSLSIILFFSSLLISSFKDEEKSKWDIGKVATNGILPLLISILYLISKDEMFILLFCILVAGYTSNVLASEIGMMSSKVPVFITSFKPARRGISGGVTWLGILGSFLGSLLIAGIFILFNINYINNMILINSLIILGTGFISSILNSVLGSSLQPKYIDHNTGLLTEVPCYDDINNKIIKGYKFFSNSLIDSISPLLILIMYLIIRAIV